MPSVFLISYLTGLSTRLQSKGDVRLGKGPGPQKEGGSPEGMLKTGPQKPCVM